MEYSPIRISTLPADKDIPFSVHILFKDTYICYKESNTCMDKPLLTKLKKQKVAKFFIMADDEVNYQTFLDQVLAESMDDPNIAVGDKADMANGVASSAVEKLQKDPGSKAAFKMTEKAATTLLHLIKNNPESLKLIFDKQADDGDEQIVKHSLNVSALSTRLAAKIKSEAQEVENMALAALVQYVSVPKVDELKRVFFIKRSEITPKDKKVINTIATETLKLLGEKDYINKEIVAFISNNEETRQGTGPNKLTKLAPLQEIMNLVNAYDRRVTLQKLAPAAAFKELQIDELGNYELTSIEILKTVLKEDGLM